MNCIIMVEVTMKKILIPLIIGSLVLGCSVTQLPSDPKDPTFTQVLQKSEEDVKFYSATGTSVYLLSIKDEAKRKKAAQKLVKLANDVEVVLNTDTSLDSLKALLVKFVADNGADSDTVLMVNLVQSIFDKIQSDLGLKFDIPSVDTDTRIIVGKALGKAAAKAVKDTASPIANG